MGAQRKTAPITNDELCSPLPFAVGWPRRERWRLVGVCKHANTALTPDHLGWPAVQELFPRGVFSAGQPVAEGGLARRR